MKKYLTKYQAGFTIIEVLIAITISSIIALVLTQLLSQSLQGGNKSDLLNNIQTNGESVMTRIATDVRSAYNVTCVSADGSALVVAAGSNYHRYWYVAPVGGASPANGYIETDTIASLDDTQSSDGSPCYDSTNPSYITGDSGSARNLTDTDPNNGVSVIQTPATPITPIFSRGTNPDGTPSDVVNINFSIVAPVKALTGFASQVPSTGIPFQTSVKVRCYKGDVSCE